MDISNKFFRFSFNIFFILTNITIYVEIVLDRIIKEKGKWNLFLKNALGLLLILLTFSLFFSFIELLLNYNTRFIHYIFLLFFSLITIFSFKRINSKYNALKLISCVILLIYYKTRDNSLEKIFINLIWKLVLMLLWYVFLYFIVTRIYLNIPLIVHPSIVYLTIISLYLITIYVIFVHFPENRIIRKERQKLVNVLVTVLVNVVISKLTYNDVLFLNDSETISLKILSVSLGIILLIFSIIDYLSLIMINYKTPFSVLRQYIYYKNNANYKLDLVCTELKDMCVDFKERQQIYKRLITEIEWFVYTGKLQINYKLILIAIWVLVYIPLTIYWLKKLETASQEININFIENELYFRIIINIVFIGSIYLLLKQGLIYIKQQWIDINFKKSVIIIQTLSYIALFSMHILYFIFNQSFKNLTDNTIFMYVTGFFVITLSLSSICIFLISKLL